MKKNPYSHFKLRSFFFFIVFILILQAFVFTASAENTLTIGSISLSPREEVEKFQPLINYVAKHWNADAQGRVLVAGSMKGMSKLLQDEKVDLYLDSAFPVLRVARMTGGKPFLRRWKKGVVEYHSVIFTRRDSGIDKVEDLIGKTLAFDEPFSTSGYLMPKATLLKMNLPLSYTALLPDIPPPAEAIGYGFSYDEENALVWVLRKKVAAAVIDNISYEKMTKNSGANLKIIFQTHSVPRHVLLSRAHLDPQTIDAVTEILIHMHENAEGKAILERFENTTKFDVFPNGADQDLAEMSGLVTLVEKEL